MSDLSAPAAPTTKRRHLISVSMSPEYRAVALLKGQDPAAFAEEAIEEKVQRMKAALAEASTKA